MQITTLPYFCFIFAYWLKGSCHYVIMNADYHENLFSLNYRTVIINLIDQIFLLRLYDWLLFLNVTYYCVQSIILFLGNLGRISVQGPENYTMKLGSVWQKVDVNRTRDYYLGSRQGFKSYVVTSCLQGFPRFRIIDHIE